MALVTTMLSSMQGGGGGGGASSSVTGVILAPVLAASTAALTVTYANGSAGIGATLTNNDTMAAFSIDGAARPVGSRILIKDQASGFQNGIYTVTTAGSGAINWVLTRTSDFDEIGEMPVGVMVAVAAGTVNAATLWEQTATVAVIGTDDITFTEFANATLTSATIGNINIAGNTISATNTNGDVVITPNALGQVEIGANASHASRLRFKEDTDNGVNYVTLGAPASLAGDTDYDLPATYPSVGGDALTSTVAGVTSWSALNLTTAVGGRLTLTTGTPVTTGDVSAAGTIYFTPYKGNNLALYSGAGSVWTLYRTAEISIAVPAAANQMYDVFVYDNAGTPTLELTAWTDDTNRATALTYQDGVLVKTGVLTRRYLGSFRTKTASQCNDTVAFRHLWNYYNRVERNMRIADTTDSWSYTTAAFQQANANAANQLDLVIGVSEDAVSATATSLVNISTAAIIATGIGVDSPTVNSAQIFGAVLINATAIQPLHAQYRGYPGVGRHILVWQEYGSATTTWYGDNGSTIMQAGIMGSALM